MNPDCKVEVLIPDFNGDEDRSEQRPRRSSRRSQSQHRNDRPALSPRSPRRDIRAVDGTARRVRRIGATRSMPSMKTKSGIMAGLGETFEEVVDLMRDLRKVVVRHHDHRPVPPALRKTPAGRTLRHARRIRRMEKDRRGDGLQTRRIVAADAQLVSRTRADRIAPKSYAALMVTSDRIATGVHAKVTVCNRPMFISDRLKRRDRFPDP